MVLTPGTGTRLCYWHQLFGSCARTTHQTSNSWRSGDLVILRMLPTSENLHLWSLEKSASLSTLFTMRRGKLYLRPFPSRFITVLVALRFLIIGYLQICSYFYSHCMFYSHQHTWGSQHLGICIHSHSDTAEVICVHSTLKEIKGILFSSALNKQFHIKQKQEPNIHKWTSLKSLHPPEFWSCI